MIIKEMPVKYNIEVNQDEANLILDALRMSTMRIIDSTDPSFSSMKTIEAHLSAYIGDND